MFTAADFFTPVKGGGQVQHAAFVPVAALAYMHKVRFGATGDSGENIVFLAREWQGYVLSLVRSEALSGIVVGCAQLRQSSVPGCVLFSGFKEF